MSLIPGSAPPFAHDLSVVNFDGRPITDDQISSLSGITSLRRLYLNGTPITDGVMTHLAACRDSKSLNYAKPRSATQGFCRSLICPACASSI